MMYRALLILWTIVLAGCARYPDSVSYRQQYSHLDSDFSNLSSMRKSDYFLVLLVDARHLDYSDNRSLFRTMVKHPSDGSKNGDVGHAWIYVEGIQQGERVFVEGGHSGELGVIRAKYFEGIMNYIDYGYANPTEEQKNCPRYEPDPVKYIWTSQGDGFFQWGSGGHQPTFAAKIDITEEQFQKILAFIQPTCYNYVDYALTRNQCSSFVAQVAALADFQIDFEVTLPVEQEIVVGGECLLLWNDPQYASLTISSPDIIERSLMCAVREGKAEYALSWYLKTHPIPFRERAAKVCENVRHFPSRLSRVIQFSH